MIEKKSCYLKHAKKLSNRKVSSRVIKKYVDCLYKIKTPYDTSMKILMNNFRLHNKLEYLLIIF